MNEKYKSWLESLKVGDKVAVETSNYGEISIKFTEITKITPTRGIRVESNESHLFKDGSTNSGGKWSSTYYRIMEITPELIHEETRTRNIDRIRSFDGWKELNQNDVEQVIGIISKHTTKEGDKK